MSSVEAKMSDLQIKVHWAALSSPSVSADDLSQSGMKTLEHVAVTVTITHPCRGDLKIELLCPSNMTSLIGARRTVDRCAHTCTQNLVQSFLSKMWFNWYKGNVTSVLLWLQKSIRSNHVSSFSSFCFAHRDPAGYQDWTFSTVRCWGEKAEGQYTLRISDHSKTQFTHSHLWQEVVGFTTPATKQGIKVIFSRTWS